MMPVKPKTALRQSARFTFFAGPLMTMPSSASCWKT